MFQYIQENVQPFGPSNVDFCESNYIVLPDVAEFWNTISNLPYILGTFFYIYRVVKYYAPHSDILPFLHHPLVMISVGIGSMLLHSNLLRFSQAADEISMLYLSGIIGWRYMDVNGWTSPLFTFFLVFCSICVVIMYLFYPELYSVFMVLFVSTYLFYFVICIYTIRKVKDVEIRNRLWRWFLYGYLSFMSGFVLWITDMFLCNDFVEILHLHAFWHLLTGYCCWWCSVEIDAIYFYFKCADTIRIKRFVDSSDGFVSRFFPHFEIERKDSKVGGNETLSKKRKEGKSQRKIDKRSEDGELKDEG